jgi:hypothetical protein
LLVPLISRGKPNNKHKTTNNKQQTQNIRYNAVGSRHKALISRKKPEQQIKILWKIIVLQPKKISLPGSKILRKFQTI